MSHRSFLRHRSPRFPPRNLVLLRHARCVLPRLRCNGHSLLLRSYLSRIGKVENSYCSACGHSSQDTSDLILHSPVMDTLRRSLFGDSLSRDPGELPSFWGSMVFRNASIRRQGRVVNNNNNNLLVINIVVNIVKLRYNAIVGMYWS